MSIVARTDPGKQYDEHDAGDRDAKQGVRPDHSPQHPVSVRVEHKRDRGDSTIRLLWIVK
jgi:hypothetical protein